MPNYYPVMLDIRSRRAIVVGGDRVAAEKASGLVACGAKVEMLNETFCDEILAMAKQGKVTLRQKAYEYGDLAGAFVVVAATHEPTLVKAIWLETQERNQLVNIVDEPKYCSYILPSILRREPLTITVSTEGTSPGLAKRIRRSLEEQFPHAYGPYLRLASVARVHLRKHNVSYDRRDDFFEDFYTSDILDYLVEDDTAQATHIVAELLREYDIDVPSTVLADELKAEIGKGEVAHVNHHA